MSELNQYDAECVELMVGLIGKGFMIFPVDPELKRRYYETAAKCNRNPIEMLREDMDKRERIMTNRMKKAADLVAKESAKTLLTRKAEEAKREREKEQQRKKDK